MNWTVSPSWFQTIGDIKEIDGLGISSQTSKPIATRIIQALMVLNMAMRCGNRDAQTLKRPVVVKPFSWAVGVVVHHQARISHG